MKNIYSEIQPRFRWIADFLEGEYLEYSVYNNGIQFNVADSSGTIHSYYPSTGTVVLHKDNNQKGTVTLHNNTLEQFLEYILNPRLSKTQFEKG